MIAELAEPAGETWFAPHGAELSDQAKLASAMALIRARGCEKLTIDMIAEQCGLNRSALTRGLSRVYGVTVFEALTNCRLELARERLTTTREPIAEVCRAAGFDSHSSFTHAFKRWSGRSPKQMRKDASS